MLLYTFATCKWPEVVLEIHYCVLAKRALPSAGPSEFQLETYFNMYIISSNTNRKLGKKKQVPESVYQELMSGEAPEYIYIVVLLAAFGVFPIIMFKVNVSVNSDCCLFPLMTGIVTSSPCTSV